MNFRSAYDYREGVQPSPVGSRYRTSYQRKINLDGTSSLEECGREDVYDSIQKASNGRLLEDLIRRSSAGDPTAIKPMIDSFVDLAGAPTDLLDAHSKLTSARDSFFQLPASIREKFGNSFDAAVNAVADGSFVKALQPDPVKPDPKVQPLSAEEISKIRESLGGAK